MPNVILLPPSGRPKLTVDELTEKLKSHADRLADHPLRIVGLRGYFPKSLGSTPGNDRAVYDDALFVWVPSKGIFAAFNGNTDPSKIRKGHGTADGTKGMAVLATGVWPVYRFADHHGTAGSYPAICQRAGVVTVMRDGDPPYPDTGHFGINIHRGGYTTTSSEGCQTVPPDQWNEFYGTARKAAEDLWGSAWTERVVAYVLQDC